jgi:hypothetical protein
VKVEPGMETEKKNVKIRTEMKIKRGNENASIK